MTSRTQASHEQVETAFGWRFSTTLILAATLNPVSSSIVATALVPIAQALTVPVGRVAPLVTSLYVASAVAQPAMGRFAQRLGPRRVFLAGALLVVVAGAVGTVGSNLPTLVVARILLGIGTSAGFPSAMLMIRRRAEASGESPGGVMGALVVASQITVLLGLPLGGLLVTAAGWRATFWVNIPLALVLFAMASKWLPRDEAARLPPGVRRLLGDLDVVGLLIFGGLLTTLVGFLSSLPVTQWLLFVGTAASAALLVLWELRARNPLIDVRALLKNRALTVTYIRCAGVMLVAYCVMYGLTQWLQETRALSATAAGLLIVPMSAVGAIVARPVSRRGLVKMPLLLSAVVSLAIAVSLAMVSKSTPLAVVIAVTAVVGVAVGLATVGNQSAVYAQAQPEDTGVAAGLLRTSGYVGAIASGSIISVVFRDGASDRGLHEIGYVLVPVTMLVLVLTALGRHLPRTITDQTWAKPRWSHDRHARSASPSSAPAAGS
jgi:MFS family permease